MNLLTRLSKINTTQVEKLTHIDIIPLEREVLQLEDLVQKHLQSKELTRGEKKPEKHLTRCFMQLLSNAMHRPSIRILPELLQVAKVGNASAKAANLKFLQFITVIKKNSTKNPLMKIMSLLFKLNDKHR